MPLTVVDFHNHYVGPSFPLAPFARSAVGLRAHWEEVDRKLVDPHALMSSLAAAGVAARVINTPTAMLEHADGGIPADTIRRINDSLAELVGRAPGRLYGLATVDAFAGDAGARELTRAVRELGLRGAFVESAAGDLLLDAPQARPTLTAAAELGVPVFVHPLTDPALHARLARFGRLGVQLARGTINSAALIALLESGTFDALPNLRIVVTTLALGGLLLAGEFGDGRLRSDAPAVARRHIYIDTMGLRPRLIRSAVDLLGADHVLAGTDWPINDERSVPERLQAALDACGLGPAEQDMVAHGNTLRLLGVS